MLASGCIAGSFIVSGFALSFLADARLGGGGEIPRLEDLEFVLVGVADAGGPRKGDGARPWCLMDL